jgi:hypothetical protein
MDDVWEDEDDAGVLGVSASDSLDSRAHVREMSDRSYR